MTCPEDITVTITTKGTARFGAHCDSCPVRSRCTTAKAGRVIVLHPHHGLLAAARQQADTDDFDDTYRRHRPMIERTIAWLVKDDNRRLRYQGIEANQLGWSHRCAAVNLRRLLALGLTTTAPGPSPPPSDQAQTDPARPPGPRPSGHQPATAPRSTIQRASTPEPELGGPTTAPTPGDPGA